MKLYKLSELKKFSVDTGWVFSFNENVNVYTDIKRLDTRAVGDIYTLLYTEGISIIPWVTSEKFLSYLKANGVKATGIKCQYSGQAGSLAKIQTSDFGGYAIGTNCYVIKTK